MDVLSRDFLQHNPKSSLPNRSLSGYTILRRAPTTWKPFSAQISRPCCTTTNKTTSTHRIRKSHRPWSKCKPQYYKFMAWRTASFLQEDLTIPGNGWRRTGPCSPYPARATSSSTTLPTSSLAPCSAGSTASSAHVEHADAFAPTSRFDRRKKRHISCTRRKQSMEKFLLLAHLPQVQRVCDEGQSEPSGQ